MLRNDEKQRMLIRMCRGISWYGPDAPRTGPIAPYLPYQVKSRFKVGVRARAAKLTAMPCA